MSYQGLSVLHIATAITALLAGLMVLLLRKGTRRHKQIGYVYVVAMLALNISALSIYRLTGTFGPFHYAAVLSLATLLAGFVPVFTRRPVGHWLRLHFEFMAWSYIGLLAAAAAEAAVRLPAAPFWPAVLAGSLLIVLIGGILLGRSHARLLTRYGGLAAQPALPGGGPRPAGSARP